MSLITCISIAISVLLFIIIIIEILQFFFNEKSVSVSDVEIQIKRMSVLRTFSLFITYVASLTVVLNYLLHGNVNNELLVSSVHFVSLIIFDLISKKATNIIDEIALNKDKVTAWRYISIEFFVKICFCFLVFILSCIADPMKDDIWVFHLEGLIVITITLFKLTKIIYSVLLIALKKELQSRYDLVFRLVICFMIFQIILLALGMYHGMVVSYKINAEYSTKYPLFVFLDNSGTQLEPTLLGSFERTSSISHSVEKIINNQPLFYNSFYYVITTFSSVGYGDIVPFSVLAKLFSMIVSFYGYIMSAMIIGSVLGGVYTPDREKVNRVYENMYFDLEYKISDIYRQMSKITQSNAVEPAKQDCDNNDNEDRNAICDDSVNYTETSN